MLAALTEFDVAAIDDNAAEAKHVFFHTPDDRDRAAAELHQQFPALVIAPVDVPDEDWAARSQASLTAVRVGSIIVAPPWDVGRLPSSAMRAMAGPPDPGEGGKPAPPGVLHETSPRAAGRAGFSRPTITIVIQPSMGFGTGHHATTRLCLDHLQQLDLRNCTALDVGTGSGVLAIAASRLGATHVLAIDDDADAIQSARENLDLNPGSEVTLGMVDVRRTTLRPFDLVLANLTGGLLTAAALRLQQLTAAGGRLILSGFMAAEEAEVVAAFAPGTIERRSQEDEWVCVTIHAHPSQT